MIEKKQIEKDKKILITDIKKYINIIKKEYKNIIQISNNIIDNLEDKIHIKETGTISLYILNNEFYFPIDAYKVLNSYKSNPIFGSNKKHKTYDKKTLLKNDNTFYTYIEHLILIGATPLQYFREILLHETMHFCGSNGANALMEGLNEYLTRKLALKYNLKTNGCGYPKEIKIIIELKKLFGEETLKQIAFSKSNKEIKLILDKINPKANKFFFELSKLMEEEFYNKYYKYKFPGLNGPIEKAKKYNDINYDNIYKFINNFKEELY